MSDYDAPMLGSGSSGRCAALAPRILERDRLSPLALPRPSRGSASELSYLTAANKWHNYPTHSSLQRRG